jgi:tetratricopeptide (TPR) repeat protein
MKGPMTSGSAHDGSLRRSLSAAPRRRAAPLALLLAIGWTGCSTPPVDAPRATLDRAASLAESEPRQALQLLASIDTDELPEAEVAEHRYWRAVALHADGRSFKAFRSIEDFADEHRFSAWVPEVQDLELDIGRDLIRREGGSFFRSNAARGTDVLRHFRQRYPTHRGGADALRLLGEREFGKKRYRTAAERFRQLLAEYPLSEWEPLASFRLAMCRFLVLQGSEYDQEAMLTARDELRGYLDLAPERPEFRSEAEAALATVERWLAEHQIVIANFYRRLGNDHGERVALEELLQNYPESDRAAEANRRLAQMPPEPSGTETTEGLPPPDAEGLR